MGYSSDFLLGGVGGSAFLVSDFGSSYPDYCVPLSVSPVGSYVVVPVNVNHEKTYRGADIEFFGNVASQAYTANEVWLGFALPGSTYGRVRQYGTIGLTTGSTAITRLGEALGLPTTSSWYPCSTISTAWTPTGYANNVVEAISLIPSAATAPSASDMANSVLTIPYLDGATHLIFRLPDTTDTMKLGIAIRNISRDA